MELFKYHKASLNRHSFDHEPALMIDDEEDTERGAYVNTIRAMETEDGLTALYDVYFSGVLLKKTTTLQFLAVVAHELGHLNGDGPRNSSQRTTVEGEADYQTGPNLLNFLLDRHPEILAQTVDKKLETAIAKEFNLNSANKIDAAKIKILTGAYLALNEAEKENIVLQVRPTRIKVESTIEEYPSPQERWSTVVAGILGLPRRTSWALLKDFEPPSCQDILTSGK